MNRPLISIIIPTFNRPDRLAGCIRGISALEYPPDRFEVIVVNDGGTDDSGNVVRQFDPTLSIHYYRTQHRGPAAARNHGAANAGGRFLVFLDDDCRPLPDWLTRMEMRLTQNPGAVVAGHACNGLKTNLYSEASQILVDYVMSYYNRDAAHASFLTSNNMGLERTTFFEVGGFHSDFSVAGGEDREFGDRCHHRGILLLDCSEVRVIHLHALTFLRFCKQHFNYGRGASTYHRLRNERTGRRMRREPLSFYRGLVFHPLSHVAYPKSLLVAGLLLQSQIANAAGFIWEMLLRNQQPRDTPIILV